jgi:hypothetical protein
MIEELAPRRGGAFRAVFLIVFAGFVVLSLPEWISQYETVFDLPYVTSLYQLLVFVFVAVLILWFLRRYAVAYQYVLADGSLSVKEKNGARETVVFCATLSADSQVIPCAEGETLIREHGWKKYRISFGVSDSKKAFLVTFPANQGNSALIFQPSDEFVKVLQQKVLDKRAEI